MSSKTLCKPGPGRFALHMAETVAALTLVDISEQQLGIARRKLTEAGLSDRVRGFDRLDALAQINQ